MFIRYPYHCLSLLFLCDYAWLNMHIALFDSHHSCLWVYYVIGLLNLGKSAEYTENKRPKVDREFCISLVISKAWYIYYCGLAASNTCLYDTFINRMHLNVLWKWKGPVVIGAIEGQSSLMWLNGSTSAISIASMPIVMALSILAHCSDFSCNHPRVIQMDHWLP